MKTVDFFSTDRFPWNLEVLQERELSVEFTGLSCTEKKQLEVKYFRVIVQRKEGMRPNCHEVRHDACVACNTVEPCSQC